MASTQQHQVNHAIARSHTQRGRLLCLARSFIPSPTPLTHTHTRAHTHSWSGHSIAAPKSTALSFATRSEQQCRAHVQKHTNAYIHTHPRAIIKPPPFPLLIITLLTPSKIKNETQTLYRHTHSLTYTLSLSTSRPLSTSLDLSRPLCEQSGECRKEGL